MKRDMDLIRTLLLKLEELPPGSYNISSREESFQIDGYSFDEIDYHLVLIRDAGFIVHTDHEFNWGIFFKGLNWQGHEYLDNIRDPEIWAKTKEGAQKLGGFSLEIVGALAKGLIKKQIEKHTGVEVEI